MALGHGSKLKHRRMAIVSGNGLHGIDIQVYWDSCRQLGKQEGHRRYASCLDTGLSLIGVQGHSQPLIILNRHGKYLSGKRFKTAVIRKLLACKMQ